MNALQYETSPYLLQHAKNPVDWYPWGNEALARAKAEDKPIIVSIGYSTCHWCHVMERESFENETTAAFMNVHFICIKVDREERPDVDQFYMEACQAISGGGGWPLNAFLLPDLRPFYAGTYYPPEPRYQRPSWRQLMMHLVELYENDRAKVEDQAKRLTDSISGSSDLFVGNPVPEDAGLDAMVGKLKSSYDLENGGYGSAPKFPMSQSLELLLEYGLLHKDEQCVQLAERAMLAMISGGIYDQIGGGFSRYTVDSAWRVPHFEKMLYDNALLLRLLAKLQLWRPNEVYRQTIIETIEWLRREMTASNGAFYSALDADSEGIEGKFYTWTRDEIRQVLPEELWDITEQYYGITEAGNWEEESINILYRALGVHDGFLEGTSAGSKHSREVSEDNVLSKNSEFGDGEKGWPYKCIYTSEGTMLTAKQAIEFARSKLYTHRESRIRPGRDEKIILQWNGLMIEALCWCHRAMPEGNYLADAQKSMTALTETLFKNAKWYRTGKDGQLGEQAFLEDEVAIGSAALELYLTDFDAHWLRLAMERADHILADFSDRDDGLLSQTASGTSDLPASTISVYDNALPSGNAHAVLFLQKLDRLTGPGKYGEEARRILQLLLSSAIKYPTSFAGWARAGMYEQSERGELIIVGPKAEELAERAWAASRPSVIIVCAETNVSELSLLENRFQENKRLLYYCRNLACGLPVETLEDLQAQKL
ncbi:MAG: thioredoxin domain-containing protein [Bacteroidota bacterium]